MMCVVHHEMTMKFRDTKICYLICVLVSNIDKQAKQANLLARWRPCRSFIAGHDAFRDPLLRGLALCGVTS